MKKLKTGYTAPKKPGKKEFSGVRIALLETRWNTDIVAALDKGARECCRDWGVQDDNVKVYHAPGAYEIPLATQTLLDSGEADAVVTLGAVIRGDTPHFDFVAGECARGLMDVQLRTGGPVGFGVLTVNTVEQAWERAGPGKTNKGYEAAAAALEMLRLVRSLA